MVDQPTPNLTSPEPVVSETTTPISEPVVEIPAVPTQPETQVEVPFTSQATELVPITVEPETPISTPDIHNPPATVLPPELEIKAEVPLPEQKTEPIQPQVKTEPIVPPPQPSQAPLAPKTEIQIEEREVIKEVKVVDEEKVSKLTNDRFSERISQNQKLGNQAKKIRHDQNLNKIIQFIQEEKIVTNQGVRDLLHVSQSTATNYLTTLTNRGILKMDRKAKATTYSY